MRCLVVHLTMLFSVVGGGFSAMLSIEVSKSICVQHRRFSTWGSKNFGILEGPLKAPLTRRKYADDCPWITWNPHCRDMGSKRCPVFSKDSCKLGDSNIQLSQPSARIVGGTEVVPHSYPSFVRLFAQLRPRGGCGATILSRNWVLTAEHCVDDPLRYMILAGRHDEGVPEEGDQTVFVDRKIFPPDLPGIDGKPIKVDLALVHLNRPLEFNSKIKPVTLPTRDYAKTTSEEDQVTLTLVGRGNDDSGRPSNVIRQVKVSLVSLEKCRKLAGPNETIQEWELCEVDENSFRGSCFGDSGGPAYDIDGSGNQILAGVISFGIGKCTQVGKISGQMSVFPFLQWISVNVKD